MRSLDLITSKCKKEHIPAFSVGDTVCVSLKIRDSGKERIQSFKGVVISRKGSSISENFTVRRISHNVGVEKIFPIHSPNVESLKVIRFGRVRRAKLYYLRNRTGKAAKVSQKIV